jgi:hypothetical protein
MRTPPIHVNRCPRALCAALVTALWFATIASAQQFRSEPIDEAAKRLGVKTQSWVRNPAEYANSKANFTDFFQKYYFPAMTLSTPNDLAELGELRANLFKNYLWATTNAELQKHLTDMAYAASMKVLKQAPAYHPAVGYNAVLVLGLLDDEYALEGGANPRPPKPHANANKALTQIVNLGTTSDRFSPPIVLGALIGLERHAKYHQSLPPPAVAAMAAALVKLVNNEKPIQGMDAEAYAWLRLRAASALANLGSLGENNAIHDSIIKLIATSKSLDDRCSAAALLSSFKAAYEKAKVDGPATTKALFKLTSDLSAEELKRALDFEKNPALAGGSLEFSSNGSDTPDDGYPRRHLIARLRNVAMGLNAVKPALPPESQKQVDDILAAFRPVVNAVQVEKAGVFGVGEALRTMNQKIKTIVGEPEAPSDDEEFSAGEASPAAAAPEAAPGAAPAAQPVAEPPADAAPATPDADAAATETPAATPPAAAPEGAKNP